MRTCKRLIAMILMVLLLVSMTGCSQENGALDTEKNISDANSQSAPNDNSASTLENSDVTELYVRFGDAGEAFTLHLYENETAAAIARHVGTADWRLPIYHYDDYENWEVMQYTILIR